MRTLGGYLLFFGIGSIIINLLGREFIILMWIDNWGTEVGWGIRVGMIVLGLLFLLIGAREESVATSSAVEPAESE